ncbi:NAD(P)/FAD-dependent oxidoreductase [Paenibacillus allorhizosphaerae]|uniref:NADH dehydrogenase-like protein YjlD n=1 Tax=Paenibacillus allorhizosphaerae TaxID=2849866 RepID=A0ABM8VB68_9BACL|nr:NAD(P)/FAD-dependent oxidoreductase [Paenibacillus allorhizosphaerae]CAG7618615.1 NADH dehydrogenase-like protein YjlD [Paenibacillus allorhizosphaerae]
MAKQILILGGGYGGLLTALTTRKHISADEAAITVVNRTPYHQIVTELHRLSVGGLNEGNVALPLDKLLRGKSVDLRIGTVQSIDLAKKSVELEGGALLGYDTLVIAMGSETAFFGIPGLEEHSFTLKSVEDANKIRAHVEARIETYGKSKDKADATFVIGGGGLSGIELIGELVDTLPAVCLEKGVDFQDVSLYCVEAAPSILAGFSADLVERAKSSLEQRGVKILTGVAVTEVQGKNVILKDGTTIEANTLVWTGGVTGNTVVANSGIEAVRGRATVNEFLQSTSHPDVFLAGDSAVVMSPEGRPYPPSAQIAWQMGESIGFNLYASSKGLPMKPFKPVFSGTLASLGRKDAIGTIGGSQLKLKGTPASLMKEASNVRYLTHINGLFSLVH